MADAVVAGHLCLDIIPDISMQTSNQFDAGFRPGRLVNIGPASISTGGAVSNTGLALQHLGINTRLLARVGTDQFGSTIRQILASHALSHTTGIVTSAEVSTSYSITISPPDSDRRFLHHPGANDDFCAEDVKDVDVIDARLFHFGYPPLMAHMYANDGAQLTELFRRMKSLGLTTSLDMAFIDPTSPAGRANWRLILKNTLPFVDIFLPSLDEISFMLGQDTDAPVNVFLLTDVSNELLEMGAKMVILKLGDLGLYLHTASASVLNGLGRACPSDLKTWGNYESWQPCFEIKAVNTSGSGDATIAGFLASILYDRTPVEALTTALAVGALNVEAKDQQNKTCTWEETWERINSGWTRKSEPNQFARYNH
jgi:sugar/nucleoside kinase (ribokinase family)